jgi:RNA polymerase sigma-70 factor (ECF subfamily)
MAFVPATDLDDAASQFARARPLLFGIAYRMLGSVADAEDIVQDAWIRWQSTDRDAVREPRAFLATTTTRLAINVADSARVRREKYVGPWLPEPVDTGTDPALGAERGEALDMAILLILVRLSPNERAAYILKEAFDYPYQRIASILQTTESNARQLASRGRKHVESERRTAVSKAEHQRLLDAFLAAAQLGDFEALEALFAADVVSLSDGGGVVRASKFPVLGRTRVARFISAFAATFWVDASITSIQANGQAALLVSRNDQVFALVTLRASASGIDQILWVMNPVKLSGIAQQVRGRPE